MRPVVTFVCALMVAVLLWGGSAARAAELIGCIEVSADAAGHFDGDDDQVPSDPDKGTPHHHGGCHGHPIAVPNVGESILATRGPTDSVGLRLAQFTAGCDPGTQLRPPIA